MRTRRSAKNQERLWRALGGPKRDFVLWGRHAAHCEGRWIKVAGGTRAECSEAMRRRRRELGWLKLEIHPAGTIPAAV